MRLQESQAPELLIDSPMCAAFSSLQHLNYRNMTAQELIDKIRDAMSHLDFALKLCEIQAKAGRPFLFEHTVQTKSWSLSLVKRLYKYKWLSLWTLGFANQACILKATLSKRERWL